MEELVYKQILAKFDRLIEKVDAIDERTKQIEETLGEQQYQDRYYGGGVQ
jgi:uncharacterized protein YdcH (DUF465 family)